MSQLQADTQDLRREAGWTSECLCGDRQFWILWRIPNHWSGECLSMHVFTYSSDLCAPFGLSVGAGFGPCRVFQPRIKRDNQMMKIKQMWKKPKQNNKVRAGWSSCCLKPQSAQTNKTHNKTKQIHFTAWSRSGFKLSQHLGTLHFSCCAEAASLPAVFVRAFRGRAVFLLWLSHATDHEAAL